MNGIGPATVLRAPAQECVLQFVGCTDVTVQNLRAEAGQQPSVAGRVGGPHLLGAISFLGTSDATVRDCELSCPDSAGRTQSCVYAASAFLQVGPASQPGGTAPFDDVPPGKIRIVGNKLVCR